MVSAWKHNENIDCQDIYAAIGPSIGPCCYIVDDLVINEVERVLDIHDDVNPYQKIGVNQYRLDLKKLNYLLLIKAGIGPDNISVSSFCTSCDSSLFFSHRRDMGNTGRMMGFIALKKE
jgi:copper oxidase (laccase) domain-containing protein